MIQGLNFLGGNFMNVILASSSPRRREIMSILTDDFICIPPDINEIAPSDIELELKPQYIATQKAKYISKGHRDAMVIGCDTSVIIDGKILNKPVIITDYPSANSQITNGFDGVIVPMDNQKCAEGIFNVLNNGKLQKELIANTKITDYSNSKEIEKLYKLIGD